MAVTFKSLALVCAAVLAAAGPALAQFCGDSTVVFTPTDRFAINRDVVAIGRGNNEAVAQSRGMCRATSGCKDVGFDTAVGFTVTSSGRLDPASPGGESLFAVTVKAECS